MKKILIGGCSWSDPNYKSRFHPDYDNSFKKWWEYLDGDTKSIGVSGAGNEHIIKKIINHIFSEEVDMVVIGLSNWLRFTVLGHRINPQFLYRCDMPGSNMTDIDMMEARRQNSWMDVLKFPADIVIENSLENNFLMLKILAEICSNRKIELYVFQMLDQCNVGSKKFNRRFFNEYVSNDHFHNLWDLDDPYVNLLGFPFRKHIGGYGLFEDFYKSPFYTNMTISDVDPHPNELGHKFIGEWLLEKIKNN